MHYSLTSCQLYFPVPLSSFLAHLLALSHFPESHRHLNRQIQHIKTLNPVDKQTTASDEPCTNCFQLEIYCWPTLNAYSTSRPSLPLQRAKEKKWAKKKEKKRAPPPSTQHTHKHTHTPTPPPPPPKQQQQKHTHTQRQTKTRSPFKCPLLLPPPPPPPRSPRRRTVCLFSLCVCVCVYACPWFLLRTIIH